MARGRAPQTLTIEMVPEADRLGDFPHPRHTLRLLGHEAAEHELRTALDGGRMHHAWMLTGRAGIGKATLAYAFARTILAAPAERLDEPGRPLAVRADCSAERQVAALSHPGLLVLRRPWDAKAKRHMTQIPVDEVRRLKGFVSLSAGGGERRVVIADSLDDMNTNAANALLKALEEPPAGLVFLLVVSEPGRVLPTIRSRCRVLALRPLADDLVLRAARTAAAACELDLPEGDAAAGLARLAEGSVGRFLALAAADGVKLQAKVRALVDRLPAVDWSAVHTLADETSGTDKADRYDLLWDLLLDALARLVRARTMPDTGSAEARAASRIIAAGRISEAAALWSDAVAEKAELDALNLDKRILLLSLVQRLARLGAAT